ncbi:hypothetical protein NKI94_17310 [Mesorhizobium australicum]|uniref:hypothetical protein n=2 Tax=Phyllobacteriaceae TaxID=69277 RepID=UPI00333682E9
MFRDADGEVLLALGRPPLIENPAHPALAVSYPLGELVGLFRRPICCLEYGTMVFSSFQLMHLIAVGPVIEHRDAQWNTIQLTLTKYHFIGSLASVGRNRDARQHAPASRLSKSAEVGFVLGHGVAHFGEVFIDVGQCPIATAWTLIHELSYDELRTLSAAM